MRVKEKMEVPGTRNFSTEIDAVEFAKDRVAEHWIVHCYGPTKSGWVVDWWVQ